MIPAGGWPIETGLRTVRRAAPAVGIAAHAHPRTSSGSGQTSRDPFILTYRQDLVSLLPAEEPE